MANNIELTLSGPGQAFTEQGQQTMVENISVEVNSNAQLTPTLAGLAVSHGQAMTTITLGGVIPLAGWELDPDRAINEKKIVELTVIVGNKTRTQKGVWQSYSVNTAADGTPSRINAVFIGGGGAFEGSIVG